MERAREALMLFIGIALSLAAAPVITVQPGGRLLVGGDVAVPTYIAATGDVTWGEMEKVLVSRRAMGKAERLVLVPATSPHAKESWAAYLMDTRPDGNSSVSMITATISKKDGTKTTYLNGEATTLNGLAQPSAKPGLAILALDGLLPMSYVGEVVVALHKRGSTIGLINCEACATVDAMSPEERERAKEADRKVAMDALAGLGMKPTLKISEVYGVQGNKFVGALVDLPTLPSATAEKSAPNVGKLRGVGDTISFTATRDLYTNGLLRLKAKNTKQLAEFATKHLSESRQRTTAAFDEVFPVQLELDASVPAADVVALIRAAEPAETVIVVTTATADYGELAVRVAEKEKADVVVGAKDTAASIVTKLAKAKGRAIALR